MSEQNFTEQTFEELEINEAIKRATQEMGFENMTPIQAQAIPVLLTGNDMIGQAQTGTGKTAAFGIPVLHKIDPENKNLQAIILCPTRELAVQAAGELKSFSQFMKGVKLLPVYGGQDIGKQIAGLRGAQIVVGTPGRVMDHMRRGTIHLDHVSTVVLDEADEMLDMGFREDMEFILGGIEGEHQTCLFSATMPPAIMEMANQFLQDPQIVRITRKELTTANVSQFYYPVKREFKTVALLRLLDFYQYKRSVIFCNTKSMVDILAEELQKAGYLAEGLHGDLSQKQRDSVMGRFRTGRLTILIATDIAARGIDVDDVEAVINYDLPVEAEYYVHRIGRTGRAGREGAAHTLCRTTDFRKIHIIESITHVKMEEKKLPSVEEIRQIRENAVIEKVTDTIMEGKSGSLIPMIKRYCEVNEIDPVVFAAAALRMQFGETKREGDDIDVNIPEKSERGCRDRADRRDRDGRGRRERREGERGHGFRRREDGNGEGRERRSFRRREDGETRDYDKKEHKRFGERRERSEGRHFESKEHKSFGERRDRGSFEERRKSKDRHEDKLYERQGGEKRSKWQSFLKDMAPHPKDKEAIKATKKKNKEYSKKALEKAAKEIQ